MSTSNFLTRNDLINVINAIFPATSEDMTDEQIQAFINSVEYNLQNQVDYIVEQGTSGIWTYRKWNSGMAECWGTYTGTTSYTANAAASGGYRTIISGIALPFTFSAAPKVTASHNGTSSHYWGSVANVATSTTEVGVTLDRGNAVSGGTIVVTFNVVGRWKE